MVNYHTPSPEEIELATKYVLELIEHNKHNGIYRQGPNDELILDMEHLFSEEEKEAMRKSLAPMPDFNGKKGLFPWAPLNPIPLKIKDSSTTASYTQKETVTFNGKPFVSYSGIKHD